MSIDIEEHHQQWLTERLGPRASPSLRRMLYTAVIEGDWWLHESSSWSFTLRRVIGEPIWRADREEVVISMTWGRFTGAERRIIKFQESTRKVAETESWLT